MIPGMPTPIAPLDHSDAENETRMISAGSTLRLRRTPASWAVICLIDQIQREHAAALARMHYDEASDEARREEAQAIADTRSQQHPLGG